MREPDEIRVWYVFNFLSFELSEPEDGVIGLEPGVSELGVFLFGLDVAYVASFFLSQLPGGFPIFGGFPGIFWHGSILDFE